MKRFDDLSEPEILALAISNEEDDARIYLAFADGLREHYPASARVFEEMAEEENGHRRALLDLYQARFGDRLPFIRRSHVKGFLERKPVWLMSPLRLEAVRDEARQMEDEAKIFYEKAAARATDVPIRKLLTDLALVEASHERRASELAEQHITATAADEEAATARRLFVMQIVQPSLAGLMDGSVSTLAPLFAAAFATQNSWDAFLVGLAASIGAGISMGFAEALSDDGSVTGRGTPWLRGLVCGLATTLGGIGHTLPYLVPDFQIATAIAALVVIVELAVISWIRARYMDTPLLKAAFQVVVGGVLVFLSGILIGSA